MPHLLLFFLLFSTPLFANDKIEAILDKIDHLYKSKNSISNIEMTIKTPHWNRTLKMKIWTRGLEDSFITIFSPQKDKGISTLKLRKEMWNYFPKINKVIKVPPSMMMGSWMGSDFTNDDLVKENTFRNEYISSWGKKSEKNYTIVLIPKKETVTIWGKVELLIEKETLFPLKQTFFDEKGTRIREMNFKEVKMMGGKSFPTLLEVIPLNEENQKTSIRYTDAKFNTHIPNNIFTRRNLQRRR